MALEEERNAKITELTESVRPLEEKVKDLESQITTSTTKHENVLYDNENYLILHDQSLEANARQQDTIDELNDRIAQKDIDLKDLHDLLVDKEEWINTLEFDLYNNKRNASDDPNQTPSKKSSTSSIASPSPMDDSKVNLSRLLLSSSEEEDNDFEVAGLFSDSHADSTLDSDEEKEPEDDGHPEAGNSTTEPGTPENPMDIN